MTDRATWTSRTSFLFAALGSAIGLGNIWRFPYMAYRNGGGAFLIPYLLALFMVGIPLMMLEFGLGHYFRRAFPQALEGIDRRFKWLGWWSVSFVMFGIVAYYGVVIAWCMCYVGFSVTQPWGTADQVNTFFDREFLRSLDADGNPLMRKGSPVLLGEFSLLSIGMLAVVWLINWAITRRQLQAGIELANRIMIPVLIVMILVLVAWSWGFPGADAGRALYLKPDWSQVFQARTWIDAFGQIFFTLSIGFGIMVAYASYLPRKTDLPANAFLAATGNCLFSIVAAFSVFAAIGYLADEQNIDLATIQQSVDNPQAADHERSEAFQKQMSSFGLLFKTYPAIVTKMGPVTGRVFGVLFFASIVVAGISSSISIVEAFTASLEDEFGWNRRRIAACLCTIAFFLGLIFCAQTGIFWIDILDHYITTYALVFVAICESLLVGWLFTAKRWRAHLESYRDFSTGKYISLLMRLVMTGVLMLTWYGLGKDPEGGIGHAIGRFAVLSCTIVLWIEEHWLDFDIRLVIPGLLIFLLDQALLQELQAPYGNYPVIALVCGGTWLGATLVVAVILTLLSRRQPDDESS